MLYLVSVFKKLSVRKPTNSVLFEPMFSKMKLFWLILAEISQALLISVIAAIINIAPEEIRCKIDARI